MSAKKAGVDLTKIGDKQAAKGFQNQNIFLLFYNFVSAPRCKRNYLLQRVKLTKKFYSADGGAYKQRVLYLVEAMKLDDQKRTKKPDEHRKGYTLGKEFRRELLAEYQVGCAEIKGVAEGDIWPFPDGKLYHKIQDYSETPKLYDLIRFDFSKSYRFTLRFDKKGHYYIDVPNFLTR